MACSSNISVPSIIQLGIQLQLLLSSPVANRLFRFRSPGKRYSCNETNKDGSKCSKQYDDPSVLSTHKRNNHPKLECEKCGTGSVPFHYSDGTVEAEQLVRSYRSESGLRDHMRDAHGATFSPEASTSSARPEGNPQRNPEKRGHIQDKYSTVIDFSGNSSPSKPRTKRSPAKAIRRGFTWLLIALDQISRVFPPPPTEQTYDIPMERTASPIPLVASPPAQRKSPSPSPFPSPPPPPPRPPPNQFRPESEMWCTRTRKLSPLLPPGIPSALSRRFSSMWSSI
jgi:hypothetical protein